MATKKTTTKKTAAKKNTSATKKTAPNKTATKKPISKTNEVKEEKVVTPVEEEITEQETPIKEEKKVSKKQEETFENSKSKNEKSVARKIFDNVFWICFAIIAFIWIFDFIKVSNEEKPVFCIKEVTHEYDDGTTDECVGLGYKVYNYHRDSINITAQFSPFFIKMKE